MCLRSIPLAAVVVMGISLSGCGLANKALREGTRIINGVTDQQFEPYQIPSDIFKPKPAVTPTVEEEGEGENRPETGLSVGSSEAGGNLEIDAMGGGNGEIEILECAEYACVDDAVVAEVCAEPSYGELKEQCELTCEKGRVQGLVPATVNCADKCNVSEEELRAACRTFVEHAAGTKGLPLCSAVIPCS